MKAIGLVVAAAALTLATGCGGGGTATVTKTAAESRPAPSVFDESQIVRHLHLRNDYYTAPNGQRCEIAVVMTSANMVSTYADAGDTVATNPAKTAGVKIGDPEKATCLRLLTTALADFPR